MEIVGTITDLTYHRLNRDHLKYHMQEAVLKTYGKDPRTVVLNLWGLKINEYKLSVGQKICAHINAQSKKYHNKWYTSLDIWDIEFYPT